MKNRPVIVAIAILAIGLLLGGTGGAIAAGQIGTNQIKDNAITSAKIKAKAVKTSDLAPSARGARVQQFVADGAAFPGSTTVTLPGTWRRADLANSTWSVGLYRNANPAYMFMLGQSAPAGEGTADGYYLYVTGGTLNLQVNGPSYGVITSIIVTRTVATSRSNNATTSRLAQDGSPARR